MATKELAQTAIASVGWAGGVNIRDSVGTLATNEARAMENGVLDEKGAFSKRLGCTSQGSYGGTTDRALSMYTFNRAGTTPQVIMHTTAGNLLYTNNPTASTITWTLLSGSVSQTEPFSYETFGGFCYMSNGVDAYRKWDGATQTTFGSAPKGRYLKLWKDTMFMSGIPSLLDRVYESAAGDPDTWPVASWVDIGKGDGDYMTALGTDGTYLIVFKRQRAMTIYDPTTLANRIVDPEKGCESHFSVVNFESNIYYLSRRGICRYLGDSPSQIISGKLDPLFDPTIINIGALNRVTSYAIHNRVGWALPEVGMSVPSLQIEYYPRLGVLSMFGTLGIGPFVFHRMPATVFTLVRSGSTEYLLGSYSSANQVLRLDAPVGTDVGVTFVGLLETGMLDFANPTRSKYIRRMRFLGRGQVSVLIKRNVSNSVYKTFQVDLSSSGDLWALTDAWDVTGSWGPDNEFVEARIHPDAYGRYFAFRFTDSTTAITKRPIEIGSAEVSVDAGGWAMHLYTAEADILGVRD